MSNKSARACDGEYPIAKVTTCMYGPGPRTATNVYCLTEWSPTWVKRSDVHYGEGKVLSLPNYNRLIVRYGDNMKVPRVPTISSKLNGSLAADGAVLEQTTNPTLTNMKNVVMLLEHPAMYMENFVHQTVPLQPNIHPGRTEENKTKGDQNLRINCSFNL